MIVTISQFGNVHKGDNGEDLPMGGKFVAGQKLTAAGESNAFASGCRFIRVATDTAITVNAYGSELFMPAGMVEFFPAQAGGTLTVAAA